MIVLAELEPTQMRFQEHTDYGSITLLFQDAVGGLQVVVFNIVMTLVLVRNSYTLSIME